MISLTRNFIETIYHINDFTFSLVVYKNLLYTFNDDAGFFWMIPASREYDPPPFNEEYITAFIVLPKTNMQVIYLQQST